MIEEFVQFLVRVVDAQLFKRIDSEILEAEYVEYAKETGSIVARIDARVDVTNEPCERSRIQRFGHLFAQNQSGNPETLNEFKMMCEH